MRKLFLGLFLVLSQLALGETIYSERLEIVPLRAADWPVFYQINNNQQVLQNANVNPGNPQAFFGGWFQHLVAGNQAYQSGKQPVGMGFLIKTRSGEVIGTLMCDETPKYGGYWETTTVLDPKYWRSGYGTEARTAMLPFYFDTLKVPGLMATIAEDNVGSTKITKSLGYTMTAANVDRRGLSLDRKRKWNQYTLTAENYRRNQEACRFHGLTPKPQEEN